MAELPYAKKSLGQHWLTDKTALEDIAESVNISGKTVLEIGPGAGTLTTLLVKKAKKVVAVEFDKALSDDLSKTLNNPANLEVVNQDILKYDLTKLPPGYIVVANIPYYLTSKLIRLLSETKNPPSAVVLLIQKEVAERLAAKPGQMSLLSVSAQVYFDVELGNIVRAIMFTPPPKVDSQVVVLYRRKQPLVANNLQKDFFIVVRAGFSERRKKLRSSLSGGLRIGKSDADILLQKAVIKPDVRAQELAIEEWVNLTQVYKSTSVN